MKSVVGIFNSLADAKRGAAILRTLGIPERRISVLAPGTKDAQVEAHVPTTESEQPGMGKAIGGTVGAALGVAGGLEAGAAVASIMVPGVGPVLAIGLIGAALLGAGGALAGAAAGGALEDALRRGRSVLIAFTDDDEMAERARRELSRAAAESLDSARAEWWIGLRDAEGEHYTKSGGDFKVDEAKYRLGFEAALHPDLRGKNYDQALPGLHEEYGDDCNMTAFRKGFERGRRYQNDVVESYKAAA